MVEGVSSDRRHLHFVSSSTVEPNILSSSSLVAYWTPSRRRRRIVDEIVGPYVKKRIDAAARGDDVPDDMLTWLIQGFPEELRTVDAMMETMMFMNFGSIHTTAAVRHFHDHAVAGTDFALDIHNNPVRNSRPARQIHSRPPTRAGGGIRQGKGGWCR